MLAAPYTSLAAVLPQGRLVTDPAELRVYECDALPVHKTAPPVVALCASRDEVVAVVRWCAAHAVPFVARGAGTGLSGGAMPVPGAVLLDVNRMRRIKTIDRANRFAVVEPGVINLHLSQAVEPDGYIYAPDPSSQSACTLGGNVAENSGGPHCLKHGVTSDHVLGLEVVLPDGEVVRLGGPHAEPGGLDLVALLTGSEGTLGVVTEITCRLVAKPESVRTVLAIYDSMSRACRTVAEITAAGILPVALEILDRRTIRAVEASVYAAGYPENAAAVLLIELDGFEAGMDADEARLLSIVRAQSPIDVRAARDPKERAKLWKGRKGAFGAMGRVDTDLYVLDGCVPRTRLEATLEKVVAIADRHGVVVSNVFHAGDGNLHPNISYDGRDADATRRVLAAGEEMLRACVDAGGTISGEHGIGVEKREFMTMIYDRNDLALQVEVRDAIDPRGLANPGKIFPARSAWKTPFALPPAAAEIAERVHAAAVQGRRAVPGGEGAHAWTRATGPDATVVSVLGLAGVVDYEPADFTIGVRAGTRWSELERLLAEHGQEIPLELAEGEGGTVGGVLARAPSGPRRGRTGSLGAALLGVEGIRPNGEPFKSGGMVVKNVAGYQLWKLFAGARGALGVVTRANFKLRPLPEHRIARVAEFRVAAEAHAFAAALRDTRLEPAAAFVIESGEGNPKVVVVFEGNEGAAAGQSERARELLAGRDAQITGTSTGERAVAVLRWLAGLSYPGAALPDDLAVVRLSVLPAHLAATSEAVGTLVAEAAPGALPHLVRAADAATGLLTVRWRAPGSHDAWLPRVAPPLAAFLALERSRGVPIQGEIAYAPPAAAATIAAEAAGSSVGGALLLPVPGGTLAARVAAAFAVPLGG